ncbi:hypothetical protein [uncultured Methylobacterium sp.]|uniref:hypothetical protein n=1 Tax=uncultured Methylobacterium sp. TaxID=157278 RepID=UPI0035CC46D8
MTPARALAERPPCGAVDLAGLVGGLYPEPERFADLQRPDRRFRATTNDATRQAKLAGRRRAVRGLPASAEGSP